MRKLAIIIFSFGLFASLSSHAQVTATWDLARDLQVSFTQGANGVWFFMESESLVHDPAVYRLLPRYLNPCQAADHTGVFAGVGCWQGTEAPLPLPICCGLRTEVGFNFTDQRVGYCRECVEGGFDGPVGYLPQSARLLSTWERLAIVAWQSPITGAVKISARFGFRVIAAASLGWSVEKGTQTLRSGRVGGWERRALASVSRLEVAKNDVLYFIVDYNPHYEPFPVDLRVTITQVQ